MGTSTVDRIFGEHEFFPFDLWPGEHGWERRFDAHVVRVWVTDAEADSYKCALLTKNGITVSEAELYNVNASTAATVALALMEMGR